MYYSIHLDTSKLRKSQSNLTKVAGQVNAKLEIQDQDSQWEKALSVKPDNPYLPSNSGSTFLKFFSDFHTCAMAHLYLHIHIKTHTINKEINRNA